ncbi:hypothetical protein D9M68_831470 [compost metagenome]
MGHEIVEIKRILALPVWRAQRPLHRVDTKPLQARLILLHQFHHGIGSGLLVFQADRNIVIADTGKTMQYSSQCCAGLARPTGAGQQRASTIPAEGGGVHQPHSLRLVTPVQEIAQWKARLPGRVCAAGLQCLDALMTALGKELPAHVR